MRLRRSLPQGWSSSSTRGSSSCPVQRGRRRRGRASRGRSGSAPPSRDADALLIATPEYNGSIPGQLKNAVDWASRPARAGALWGKTVAVIGATTGSYGAIWAQADLRRSLGIAGARVLEVELPVARAHERFDESGNLLDEQLRERLGDVVLELAAAAEPLAVAA